MYRDAGEVEATAAEPESWGQAVTEGVRDLGGRVAEEVDAAQDDRAGSWPSEREGGARLRPMPARPAASWCPPLRPAVSPYASSVRPRYCALKAQRAPRTSHHGPHHR